MIMGRFGLMWSILAHDHETARAKVLPTPERGVRHLWKPPAWSSADHRSHGEPGGPARPGPRERPFITGTAAGGSACSSPGRPPAGAPVHHRDGRSLGREGRSLRRDRAGGGRPTAAAPGGAPGASATHPASSASRQAERPLRLRRKIRPLRKIRATRGCRILPGSRILRENGTGEAERTKPSPAARLNAHGPGLAAHRSRKYGAEGTRVACVQPTARPSGWLSVDVPLLPMG